MKTYTETKSGEIVQIIGGTLVCHNDKQNLLTIAEWISAQPEEFQATITFFASMIKVDFPESVPTHMMGSLLEAFEYQ